MATALTILTILKALIVFTGLMFTFWYFMRGITNKDSKGKSKALKYFIGTTVAIIALSVLEFVIFL